MPPESDIRLGVGCWAAAEDTIQNVNTVGNANEKNIKAVLPERLQATPHDMIST
jgi:hypothetical protein